MTRQHIKVSAAESLYVAIFIWSLFFGVLSGIAAPADEYVEINERQPVTLQEVEYTTEGIFFANMQNAVKEFLTMGIQAFPINYVTGQILANIIDSQTVFDKWALFAVVWIHGLPEMAGFALIGLAGLRIPFGVVSWAVALSKNLHRKSIFRSARSEIKFYKSEHFIQTRRHVKRMAIYFTAGCALLLFAAYVEVHWTEKLALAFLAPS